MFRSVPTSVLPAALLVLVAAPVLSRSGPGVPQATAPAAVAEPAPLTALERLAATRVELRKTLVEAALPSAQVAAVLDRVDELSRFLATAAERPELIAHRSTDEVLAIKLPIVLAENGVGAVDAERLHALALRWVEAQREASVVAGLRADAPEAGVTP